MNIQTLINSSLKEHKITGASVSIATDCVSPMIYNYGYAVKSQNSLVENSTIFKIGSITKVFTATAVMQLVEQGKIDIDKSIGSYIREFSVKTRFAGDSRITVRDILCHHSGLPCDNFGGYFTDDLTAFHSAVPYLKNVYAVAPPGTRFYYSNLGYELLGVLISRTTGIPFHEYIEKNILQPLGMSSSALSLSEEKLKCLSKPYRNGKEQIEPPMKAVPEGGIYSTTTDMAGFMQALLNDGRGIFKDPSTLGKMLLPQYPHNRFDMDMINGLGWFIGKPGLDYAGKVIWHDGGTPNFFSIVILVPERKLGVTILTNSTTGAILNHTLSVSLLQKLMADTCNVSVPKAISRAIASAHGITAQAGSGRFFTLSGIAEITRSRSGLVAKLPNGKVRLVPYEDGWFGVQFLLFGFIPIALKSLSILRLGILEMEQAKILALEQIGVRSAYGMECHSLKINQKWTCRTGKYICTDEESPRLKSFHLKLSKEGLLLSAKTDKIGILNIHLDTINDLEAITLGYGRYSGETITAINDDISVFGLIFKKQ